MTSTGMFDAEQTVTDKAPVSASKSERVTENMKESDTDLYSDEKSNKIKQFDLSGDNHRSVPKSSTKQQMLTFSAKKAPVFVYHETKSSQKIRIDSKRESSVHDSNSSQGAKPFSQALDPLQPTSALTKATADGCHFQDDINTPDQELRELRKNINGETGNPDDRYFEEGSLRYGLFNNEFDEDSKAKKKSNHSEIQNINFYSKPENDENEQELRSDQNQAAQHEDQMIIQISNNRSKLKISTSLLPQGNPETGSKHSERSKGTSMNDLTLSDEPDSASMSDRDSRKPSKPRSEQESGLNSGNIDSSSIVPAKPQIRQSCSISETSRGGDDDNKPQLTLKLGGSKKTPMKNKMSRLQMFKQKLLQSEDSIKIDTLQQKSQKLDAKNAQSSISISLRSRASSRPHSRVNTKASPPRRYTTNFDNFAKGVDLSKDDKGKLPRTPLSPPQQPCPPATMNGGLQREQGKIQRGSNVGGLGIITQGLRNQKDTTDNINSETIVTGGQGGLRCFSSLLKNDGSGHQADSGERKPETYKSPNLQSEESKRSSLRGLSAQQALQKSIKKLNRMQGDNKSTPATSFDYNGCSSPSYDSYYELEEDLRTFEEKYKILENVVLGEGCSSVVKECVLRPTSPLLAAQGINLVKMQINQSSPNGGRGSAGRALQPGKYGSSPLVFGKNIQMKNSNQDGENNGADPNQQLSGLQSPDKMAGLRLKIVKCEGTEPTQEQTATEIADNGQTFNKAPLLQQPAIRPCIGSNRTTVASIGRSHSLGGFTGGSLLRLHEVGIQKINEVDEDQIPSTRRNHQQDKPLSNRNNKQATDEKKNENDATSSEDSSCFSEQPHSASDSPEAIEQQISQVCCQIKPKDDAEKVETDKKKIAAPMNKDGVETNLPKDKSGSKSSNLKEEDSVSSQSSDLEFVQKQTDGLKSCPTSQTLPDQKIQGKPEIGLNFTPEKMVVPTQKQSPVYGNKVLQNITPIKNKTATEDQPKMNLQVSASPGREPIQQSPSTLQLTRKRSSSTPGMRYGFRRSGKKVSPKKTPKAPAIDASPEAQAKNEEARLAVKIIRTNDVELIEVAYEEYKLLRSIYHDNIVKMHDAFYNQMKCTMYLVMDMVQGQSITQMLEPSREHELGGFDNERNCEALKKPMTTKFTEDESKYIFMQLLDVIDYLSCEEIGICHRDINPNNLMLDDITDVEKEEEVENRCSDFKDNNKEADDSRKQEQDEHRGEHDNQNSQADQINDFSNRLEKLAKKGPNFRKFKLTLIDFNVAKRFLDLENGNPLLMMTNTGTARYQAPEMLGGWMSRYDQRVDLWSAGAVLYYLLTGGIHAFGAPLQSEIERTILEADFDKSLPEYQAISESAKDLINGLITVDVDKRLTVEEAKMHKWFTTSSSSESQ